MTYHGTFVLQYEVQAIQAGVEKHANSLSYDVELESDEVGGGTFGLVIFT